MQSRSYLGLFNRLWFTFRATALLSFLVLSASVVTAQPATGTVSGRVFNPATQEYVRNAEVAIPGTNHVTYTADDGSYSFTGVPAGETTVTVNYTGYEPASAKLTVSGGQIATRDFDLKGIVYAPKAGESVVAVRQAIGGIAERGGPTLEDASRFANGASKARLSKFDRCLPEELLGRLIVEGVLDVEGARAALRAV